ncbi:MAG: 4-diphosphocytidyl-2C-methyl-D-erythritol kinase [Alphaproteobacteria bacterium]|nr:MAG: 4-diphosphocytidyl-2C-methyl-D-erythritol kinase [Alphaproteobacteria bacterium]
MIFKDMPVAASLGSLLAHGLTAGNRRFKKGHVIDATDIADLTSAGIKSLAAFVMEADDVDENSAADQLADRLVAPHIAKSKAFTGRCNLIAEADGLLVYDEDRLHSLNLLDESITLAMLPPFSRVRQGQMLGTVKIIPFAVPTALLKDSLDKAIGLATLHPFRSMNVQLFETRLLGPNDKISSKLRTVTEARIRSLGGTLVQHHHCYHSVEELQVALPKLAGSADLILISGASATTDRRDVVPTAITASGGTVDHFGMPVDPGNLLVLGHHGDTPIIGLPGCAKSPKLNGFDWVLERIACGLRVTSTDIMKMGAGGLLKEIGSRPQPRGHALVDDMSDDISHHKLATIVLAAGKSSRMGGANKLLAEFSGKSMIAHTLQQVIGADIGPTIVVTGRDATDIKAAIDGTGATITHNPDYENGMASSLRTGINALPADIDGALICLGDMPLVTADQMKALAAAFDPVEGRGICVPTHQGKWGNPVLWSATYFDEIRAISGDKGARDLLHHHGDRVFEVAMDDATILQDFDTPESLATLK